MFCELDSAGGLCPHSHAPAQLRSLRRLYAPYATALRG